MDAAAIFLVILVVFCVFQGMLIARVRGLANEIDILKSALPGSSTLSNPDGSAGHGTTSGLSPEVVAALAAAMGGVKDGD